MGMKPRVNREEFKSRGVALAEEHGSVVVTDDNDNERFRLTIPKDETPEEPPFIIRYFPQKGITRTLNANASMIPEIESSENAKFCGVIAVPEGKLLGFIFRRND